MPKTCACWVGFGCCFTADDDNCNDNGKHLGENSVFGSSISFDLNLERFFSDSSNLKRFTVNVPELFFGTRTVETGFSMFVEIDFTRQKRKLAINSRLSTGTEKSFKQFQNWCDHPLSRVPPSQNGDC